MLFKPREPGYAFTAAALHFHHMRHRMRGP